MHGDGEKHLSLLKDFLKEFVVERGYDEDISAQSNSFDCGAFMCKFADCLFRQDQMKFSQKDMSVIRKEIEEIIRTEKLFIWQSSLQKLIDLNSMSTVNMCLRTKNRQLKHRLDQLWTENRQLKHRLDQLESSTSAQASSSRGRKQQSVTQQKEWQKEERPGFLNHLLTSEDRKFKSSPAGEVLYELLILYDKSLKLLKKRFMSQGPRTDCVRIKICLRDGIPCEQEEFTRDFSKKGGIFVDIPISCKLSDLSFVFDEMKLHPSKSPDYIITKVYCSLSHSYKKVGEIRREQVPNDNEKLISECLFGDESYIDVFVPLKRFFINSLLIDCVEIVLNVVCCHK
uniref:Ubiquitin-like protease family profile domain-containing protein n=1 Tax=Ditylenchus dipsaci TaxID=166011 RepID=A0A915DCK8_9BILA